MSTVRSNGRLAHIAAISLAVISAGLAVYAWRADHSGPLGQVSPYSLFPLFGLLAFSLLWCLYTVGAASKYFEAPAGTFNRYYQVVGYAILAAIVAHPTILVVQLYRDGFGLPPGSYSAYVAQGLEWVALLGTASLFVFLLYELRRWFDKRGWWKWIVYLNDLAMLAILYHSLTLGGDLQTTWLRYLWFFYGVMLVIYLVYLRIYGKLSTSKVS